jgi:hypothetical protein
VWRPADLLDVLALSDRERLEGERELAGVATGLGPVAPTLLEAVMARVERAG